MVVVVAAAADVEIASVVVETVVAEEEEAVVVIGKEAMPRRGDKVRLETSNSSTEVAVINGSVDSPLRSRTETDNGVDEEDKDKDRYTTGLSLLLSSLKITGDQRRIHPSWLWPRRRSNRS